MLRKLLDDLARNVGGAWHTRKIKAISTLVDQSEAARLMNNLVLAEKLARKAARLGGGDPRPHHVMGRIYADHGDFSNAAECIEKSIQINPKYAVALQDLGNVYRMLNDDANASSCYQHAIELDDSMVLAWLNWGMLLADAGKNTDALFAIKRALDQNPLLIQGLQFLARELSNQERYEEALEYLFRAHEQIPNSADILNGIGFVLQKKDLASEAVNYYKRGLEIAPENAELWGNLGIAYQDLGLLDEAIGAYEYAQSLRPDWLVPSWHRSLAQLLRGDFRRGWEGYELRLLPSQSPKPREFPFKRWVGDDVVKQTVLVYGEQGIGDEIMFASCLPDLLDRCAHCVIECSNKLAPIFRRSFPTAKVVGTDQSMDLGWLEAVNKIDQCIPIGSLPLYFRRERRQFPIVNSYLRADEHSTGYWRNELEKLGSGLKVGISWKGGTAISRKNARSIALEHWLPILNFPDAHFVSLQYGEQADALQTLRSEHGITVHYWDQAIQDYDQTAALVSALDVVISVTTAVIHLAGALGQKTWVLVPSSPTWRYGMEGEDMPWYPSVRLFRQESPGQWDSVIKRICKELGNLAETS